MLYKSRAANEWFRVGHGAMMRGGLWKDEESTPT